VTNEFKLWSSNSIFPLKSVGKKLNNIEKTWNSTASSTVDSNRIFAYVDDFCCWYICCVFLRYLLLFYWLLFGVGRRSVYSPRAADDSLWSSRWDCLPSKGTGRNTVRRVWWPTTVVSISDCVWSTVSLYVGVDSLSSSSPVSICGLCSWLKQVYRRRYERRHSPKPKQTIH